MKSKNKDYLVLWIIGGILLLLVLTQLNIFEKKEMVSLDVHYYNDGVEIFPEKSSFSVITPPGRSYNQISFDIHITNTGNIPINEIQLVGAYPKEFNDAIQTTNTTLNPGESITWKSYIIDTAQFESMVQPISFLVNISARDIYTGEIGYVYGGVTLKIENALVVTGAISLGGDLYYNYVDFRPGSVVTINSTGYLNIIARDYIIVSGTIVGTGLGNSIGGYGGPGGAPTHQNTGQPGGTGTAIFSSTGGSGAPGAVYQSSNNPGGGPGLPGSIPGTISGRYEETIVGNGSSGAGGGGGASEKIVGAQAGLAGSPGSPGGATIRLNSKLIIINGTINSNGGPGAKGGDGGSGGTGCSCGGGGGGSSGASAGQLILDGETINMSYSTINLIGGLSGPGGPGGTGCTYGVGGTGASGVQGVGGRIKIFYGTLYNSSTTISVAGSTSGTIYYLEI